jgi:uncharacterized membrane protein
MLLGLPLHPIVIHFPIALLLVGVLVQIAGLITKKDWLSRASLLMLILGALGTFFAVRSGHAAEETVIETPAIEATLERHEDLGEWTMWFFLVLAASRVALGWWRKPPPAIHWIFVVAWLGGAGLLVWTAYHGGELVYRHGAGVGTMPAATPRTGHAPGADDD